MTASLPENEDARLAALREYRVLDTAPEDSYDDIVRLAAFICGTPIAAVTLIDERRQWFKAAIGLSITETPRELAFCAHTILNTDLTVVLDATEDTRFADNPLVTADPHIRFYAGMPLVTKGGHALGSLCVIDRTPRVLTPEQEAALRTLARQVTSQMELARLYDLAQREVEERHVTQEALRMSNEILQEQAARLAEAQRLAHVGSWELDMRTGERNWSEELFRIFGLDPARGAPDEATERACYHPDDLPLHDQALAELLTTGRPTEMDARAVRPNGEVRWCHLTARPVWDERGQMVRVVGTAADITERKRAEDERTRLADYNRLLLESTAESIYGMDTQGRCTFINQAATRLLGYAAEEVLGRDMHVLIHHTHVDGSHYPVEDCPIYTSLQQGLSCRVDTEVLWRRDGTAFPASYSSFPITDTGGVVGAVVTFSDITDQRRVEEERAQHLLEAQERADRDPVTDLLNHRSFHSRLQEEAARATREGITLAVVMLDLDNFKFFNDMYGHAVGDEVLRQVAERLRSVCRREDVVVRYGGDEFALILTGVGDAPCQEIEGQVRSRMDGLMYHPAEEAVAIPISISAGAATYPFDGLPWQEAVDRADERLRRAKAKGSGETEADRVRLSMRNALEGFSMMDALVTAVDNKDRYTRHHSEDVLTYSLMIARELELDGVEQHTVAVAALLHDVGKIGVPDTILRKPGRLTDAEFEAVKQHPLMGSVIVGAVPGLEGTLDAVRHHHERWDGTGYPSGLKGENTPLIARLMAVADAFSAMTTDRPYRKGMDRVRASSILREGAGTQWDPSCVSAFLRAIE